ncbi:hypothetical protein ACMZ6Y_07735 [Streptococcus pluranimalium]
MAVAIRSNSVLFLSYRFCASDKNPETPSPISSIALLVVLMMLYLTDLKISLLFANLKDFQGLLHSHQNPDKNSNYL